MTPNREALVTEITDLIDEVLADRAPGEGITESSTLDMLGLESLDLVRLAGRLQARYPDGGNLAVFATGLPAGGLGELEVGDLVDVLAGHIGGDDGALRPGEGTR